MSSDSALSEAPPSSSSTGGGASSRVRPREEDDQQEGVSSEASGPSPDYRYRETKVRRYVGQSEEDKMLGRLDRYISGICREVPRSKLDASLTILKKITANVSKRPINPKHRTLKLANPKLKEKLFQYPSVVPFLECLGFEKQKNDVDEEVLELTAEMRKVVFEALKLLDIAEPPIVLPSSRASSEAGAAADDEEKVPEGGMPRDIRVFSEDGLQRAKAQAVNLSELDPSDHSDSDVLTKEDKRLIRKGAAADRRLKNQLNPAFLVTKDKLEAMKVRRKYNKAIVCLRFPNKLIVEASFHPMETVQHVFDFARSCLSPSVQWDFTLHMMPRTLLKDPSQTVRSVGMLPACNLRLSWKDAMDTDEQILRDDLVALVDSSTTLTSVPSALNAAEASKQPDFDFGKMLPGRHQNKSGSGGGRSSGGSGKPSWMK